LQHAALALPDQACTVWFKPGLYSGPQEVVQRFSSPVAFKSVVPYRAVLEASETVLRVRAARNVSFEGFEIRHAGPGSQPIVVEVRASGGLPSEDVVFKDNLIHDSWNNDLLKILGAEHLRVEGNVFYNQAGPDEHIDVNGSLDVEIVANLFFNDFAGSGRTDGRDTSSFIVVKDSEGAADGTLGSQGVRVRRNVFLNWQGRRNAHFVLMGEDGQPFAEARDVVIENNLMLGNGPNPMRSPLGIQGARDILFRNNTVVGDLPARAYAASLSIEGDNPQNDGIVLANNIFADPNGTMGFDGESSTALFSIGGVGQTAGAALRANLYWNGGERIVPGYPLDPRDDQEAVRGDPRLDVDYEGLILPRWTGTAFLSGATSIRQEFERIVRRYAAIAAGSAAIDRGDPNAAASEDILGRPRSGIPDVGAYEFP
jgi:hypothetical protein